MRKTRKKTHTLASKINMVYAKRRARDIGLDDHETHLAFGFFEASLTYVTSGIMNPEHHFALLKARDFAQKDLDQPL